MVSILINLDRPIARADIKARNGRLRFTWDLDEGVPDAGPPAVLERHPLHLVRRRRRPEREPRWERPPAQPARVEPGLPALRRLLLPGGGGAPGADEEHQKNEG